MTKIDIDTNRSTQKWTLKQKIGRILWGVVSPLFRLSPRPFWVWRRLMLRCFGATIGENAHIYPSVKITIPWNIYVGDQTAIGENAILYALGEIKIGARATVSQYAHICAGSHDIESSAMELVKTPILIQEDAWICADAFLGPGVKIGKGAIVGARAVVTKNVEPLTVVAGNPAGFIRRRIIRS